MDQNQTARTNDVDGFDIPFRTPNSGTQNGDIKSPTRIDEPQREPERIAGFDAVSPFDVVSPGDLPTPKRRGRPPGSGRRAGGDGGGTPQEKASSNLGNLNFEGLLLSGHFLISQMMRCPELEIDQKEAERLSDALKKVAVFYTQTIDPKKIAIGELVLVAGGIYGPRFYALAKKPKEPKAAPGPTLVKTGTESPKQPQQKVNPRVEVPSQVWDEAPQDSHTY